MSYSDAARAVLKERFRKVILGAGYTNPQPILDEYFEKYMSTDVGAFMEMLGEYEREQHERQSQRDRSTV